MTSSSKIEALREKLWDERWRITSWKIYSIKNKQGETIDFMPNDYQMKLYDNRHTKNIIPKARQLWFSTMIDIMALDYALFHKNASVGIIAHDKDSVISIFENKVKFARDHLPDRLKDWYHVNRDRANKLSISRDKVSWSSISVAQSFRSGTLQFLHISEHWKICSKYPLRAKEIKSGTIESVPIDWQIYIESTGEWDEGDFYDWTMEAYENDGKQITPLDYKLHFFPRHDAEEYTLWDQYTVQIPDDLQRYFEDLEEKWIELTEWQKKRYTKKKSKQKDTMKREYPSTLPECFDVPSEWKYYKSETLAVIDSGRLRIALYDPNHQVHVAGDIGWAGWGDLMSMRFVQYIAWVFYIIDFREDSWYSLAKMWSEIFTKKKYNYWKIYLPFDAFNTQQGDGRKRADHLTDLWYDVVEVPRLWVSQGIELVRLVFHKCVFDETNAIQGFKRLKNYSRKWSSTKWWYIDKPEHDINSHWADGFRYFATMVDDMIPIHHSESTVETSDFSNLV